MITTEQLSRIKTPFSVKSVHDGHKATVIGFSQNDPLGVGGGIFPDMPTAYYEGGGWNLLSDLMKHYEIDETAALGQGEDK